MQFIFSYYYSKDEVFSVGVVEITIPWDGRVEAARAEKRQTYSALVEALSGNLHFSAHEESQK